VLGTRHSITKHFTAQLELEISAAGLATEETRISCHFPQNGDQHTEFPPVPMSGLLYKRAGKPMTVDEMQVLSSRANKFNDATAVGDSSSSKMSNSSRANSTDPKLNADPFSQPTVGTSGVSKVDGIYTNTPGVLEPAARVVSSFPSFTPMLSHTKVSFPGIDSHSRSVADEIPNPESFPLKFSFRPSNQSYQPAASHEWSQPQPQSQTQPRPPPESEPSAFFFANPTWFDPDSLNNLPANSELDDLLDGIQWEPSGPNQ
jgi:hypothetical protein